jgi:predicted kinase
VSGPTAPPAPLLVIVSGKPGSGKSTLAQRLGDRGALWLPVVSHDALRSGLREPYLAAGRAPEIPVQRSIGLFYRTVEELLQAGVSLIADLSFRRGLDEPRLRPLGDLARIVDLHCELSADVAARRFAERERALRPEVAPSAGPAGHLVEQMARGEFDWSVFDPLDLDVPRLRVDTADGYAPSLDGVAAFCRAAGQQSSKAEKGRD